MAAQIFLLSLSPTYLHPVFVLVPVGLVLQCAALLLASKISTGTMACLSYAAQLVVFLLAEWSCALDSQKGKASAKLRHVDVHYSIL